jgi:hypothetical protein
MFLCPECGRPARVLYARYFSERIWFFNCRKCTGISYQSTMGHRWDRSARQVEKLRARLQWQAGGTEPIRPRGMHKKTYERILGAISYHETVRKRARGTLERKGPISIALISGGNVETGLRSLVDGRPANSHLRSIVIRSPTLIRALRRGRVRISASVVQGRRSRAYC